MFADRKRHLVVAAALGLMFAVGLFTGCGDDESKPVTPIELAADTTGTCLSCHQDAEILQATANPEPPVTGDPGEG